MRPGCSSSERSRRIAGRAVSSGGTASRRRGAAGALAGAGEIGAKRAGSVWRCRRFLLRLPYGAGTSPVESFAFEEMPESVHAPLSLGQSGVLLRAAAGPGFPSRRVEPASGVAPAGGGTAAHVYQEDGASVAKPCAEILLGEKDAEFLLENGIMPLASLKDEDAALLVRFESIAIPPSALSGRWEN